MSNNALATANFPGTDSSVLNGRLVGMMQSDAWDPSVIGPTIQGVTSPAPNVPPAAVGLGQMPTSVDPNQMATQAAAARPWDPRSSPLLFIVLAVIIGYAGLRYVHWEF